jgi:MoxR-like ATPase
VNLGYPEAVVEQSILNRYIEGFEADQPETYGVSPLLDGAGLDKLRRATQAVRVEPRIIEYISTIVRATREAASLTMGASPRAGVALLKAARSAALIEGRDYVSPDDVKDLALPVMRHRVQVAPELELEGVTADVALKALLERIEAPGA